MSHSFFLNTKKSSTDLSKKLIALGNLKKEGLISHSEYLEKREDIPDEDWGK